jgi:hypothetical protein
VAQVPYVRKDEEQRLRDLLAAGRPALLVGSSMKPFGNPSIYYGAPNT